MRCPLDGLQMRYPGHEKIPCCLVVVGVDVEPVVLGQRAAGGHRLHAGADIDVAPRLDAADHRPVEEQPLLHVDAGVEDRVVNHLDGIGHALLARSVVKTWLSLSRQ